MNQNGTYSFINMKKHRDGFKSAFLFLISLLGYSIVQANQTRATDSIPSFNREQCIQYALNHQPILSQAVLNQSITKLSNSISLAGWLPQASISANLTHYLELPTSFMKDASGNITKTKTGVTNTAIPALSVTQAIFSPSLLYAVKTAPLYNRQAQLITDSTKIFLVAIVSKSYYNLLLTLQQIHVLEEDTARLGKNLSDAYHQYVAGIVDETDYDQAAITLNNSKAQLRQATENINPQYALLKQLMGYPSLDQFNIIYDTLQMMKDINFDTTQQLQYERRIELKQIQNYKDLQHQLTAYYQKGYLPTLSAFFNYNLPYQNNVAASLFSNSYPYSYLGLSLNLPVFTGFARIKSVQRSKLQEQMIGLEETNLKSQIYSEYTTALANYKSNWYNLNMLKENVDLAKKVYEIVQLQYQQGVVAYLNVITAESNLISSEIGYSNALFQLLSSKIDLEKAMGFISY
jgi:outer membrane protein TolC